MPTSHSLGLEVVRGDEPIYALTVKSIPPTAEVSPARSERHSAEAGGAAFVQLVIPSRAVYVGESVPVDIEVGLRRNRHVDEWPARAQRSDFTLQQSLKQPKRSEAGSSSSPFHGHELAQRARSGDEPGDFSCRRNAAFKP